MTIYPLTVTRDSFLHPETGSMAPITRGMAEEHRKMALKIVINWNTSYTSFAELGMTCSDLWREYKSILSHVGVFKTDRETYRRYLRSVPCARYIYGGPTESMPAWQAEDLLELCPLLNSGTFSTLSWEAARVLSRRFKSLKVRFDARTVVCEKGAVQGSVCKEVTVSIWEPDLMSDEGQRCLDVAKAALRDIGNIETMTINLRSARGRIYDIVPDSVTALTVNSHNVQEWNISGLVYQLERLVLRGKEGSTMHEHMAFTLSYFFPSLMDLDICSIECPYVATMGSLRHFRCTRVPKMIRTPELESISVYLEKITDIVRVYPYTPNVLRLEIRMPMEKGAFVSTIEELFPRMKTLVFRGGFLVVDGVRDICVKSNRILRLMSESRAHTLRVTGISADAAEGPNVHVRHLRVEGDLEEGILKTFPSLRSVKVWLPFETRECIHTICSHFNPRVEVDTRRFTTDMGFVHTVRAEVLDGGVRVTVKQSRSSQPEVHDFVCK